MEQTSGPDGYSYLGPAGTFTEAALKQVAAAAGKPWHPVNNVGEALADVQEGRSVGAVIAIENSIEGGVTATLDALAARPGLRITGEYLVPVEFVLVARPGKTLDRVRIVNAHPVAYAQCRGWLERELPASAHIPSSSNVAAAASLFADATADAAIAPPGITDHFDLDVLARDLGDDPGAATRFVLVSRSTALPERTGADKTSVIVELPDEEPGSLLAMLEQFSTRGVNMSLLQSRPILGDAFNRYRFVIDLDGHVHDERVADALLGLRRYSPKITFLGSYPRADGRPVQYEAKHDDEVFIEARDWLRGILSGEPAAD
ncbi:prephenate dehydratase [Agromyces seonyuensis]|uniref:Prephenate dehydratase n=1 Tax=Agromyces seonyuensis TaxID=2662446 RepID=A0A6I4P227_9MICO|nr:prephenate dehydratase [Agromyces seonyuensis]MWB98099.1 prephenate dehydratase [Agromyces seonyuensis]